MRKGLRERLVKLGAPNKIEWKHIVDQIGMFSYTGLNRKYKFLRPLLLIFLKKYLKKMTRKICGKMSGKKRIFRKNSEIIDRKNF